MLITYGDFMKTEKNKLYERGYIDSDLLSKYVGYTEKELLNLLKSSFAYERSVAVHLLAVKPNSVELYTEKILKLLEKERKLYTKLEIMHFLEKGNEQTVKWMIPYLEKIGKNQYKEVPNRPSYKMSYPLPRDIIARILANMDPELLPLLLQVLKTGDITQKREIIDAIGFMIFYHPQTATKENLILILDFFGNNKDDLLKWKLLILLSSFPFEETIYFLEKFLKQTKVKIEYETASRSLFIIEKRRNKFERDTKKISNA